MSASSTSRPLTNLNTTNKESPDLILITEVSNLSSIRIHFMTHHCNTVVLITAVVMATML